MRPHETNFRIPSRFESVPQLGVNEAHGRTENEGKKLYEEVHETAYECRRSVTAPTAAVPSPCTAAGTAAAASSNHQSQSSD
nr:hypothetical transcript [Hymenolepis microstoma]